jgi:CheY-like chemotaxis protein
MEQKIVLVVEDNELNQKLVKQLLLIGKFNALLAMDAEIGIEMARETLPDLILMDIQLPGMNGFEATQQIKSDPRLCRIPVVALTSFAMQGDEQKAYAAGCCGYISKPINTRSFLQEVANYIAESEASVSDQTTG